LAAQILRDLNVKSKSKKEIHHVQKKEENPQQTILSQNTQTRNPTSPMPVLFSKTNEKSKIR
jgi:hypothetical protein